jgi:UDP-N-acetyl-D-glucosamine/UDP-N-acetyl-D-galactosamine dehydrogenase
MSLFEKIKNKEEKISVVGLGYVGMPIAVAFSKKLMLLDLILVTIRLSYIKKGLIQLKR